MNWELIAPIVGGVFGSQVIVATVQGFFAWRKTGADAASTLVTSMLEWQKTLTNRIAALEAQLQAKEQIITDLQSRIVHLEAKFVSTKEEIS